MSGATVCPACQGTDIDIDRARGNAVCTGCGQVLEDSMIVNDTEFAPGVGDSKRAIGQFVGANERGMRSSFAGFHPGIQQEYLEVTLEKGRRIISQQAAVLSIHTHCAELAHGFYKMLVERKFTRGRRNALVAASCLYLACRNEQLPYLLFDFSDQLEESVTELGRMYIRIANELCINPPTVDPCLYIERFAERLDFAEETKDVAMTAMRILSRMKRDWIAAGRRPFGLCGASLYLAAKMHGFHRTLSDIVKVVGAQIVTMTKRLKEFTHTATSKLTIEEFYLVDLEEEHDPPSFHQVKKKETQPIKLPKFSEEEFQKLDNEIEQNLKKSRSNCDSNSTSNTSSVVEQQKNVSTVGLDLSEDMGLPKDTLRAVDNVDGVTDVLQNAIEDTTDDYPGVEATGHLPVTCLSLGIDPLTPTVVSNSQEDTEVDESEELYIDDLDDREIDSYLLSQEEADRKAVIWTATYGQFMEQRAAKRKLREEEKERAQDSKRRRSAGSSKNTKTGYTRRTLKKLSSDAPAATASEAIDNIIKQKNISEKINYDVLKDLRIEKPVLTPTVSTESSTSSASAPTNLTTRLVSAFRKSGAGAASKGMSGVNASASRSLTEVDIFSKR